MSKIGTLIKGIWDIGISLAAAHALVRLGFALTSLPWAWAILGVLVVLGLAYAAGMAIEAEQQYYEEGEDDSEN